MENRTKTVLLSLVIFIIILSLSLAIIKKNSLMERQMPPSNNIESENYEKVEITDSWRKYLRSMAIREFGGEILMPEAVLRDLDGNDVRVSEFRNNLVIIEFWAPNCFYCVKSMPHLEKSYNKFKERGLVVLAITVPQNPKSIRDFKQKQELTFPLLIDSKGFLFRFFKVRGIPHYVLVDRGRIIGDAIGLRDWYSEDAQALIEGMLTEEETRNQ